MVILFCGVPASGKSTTAAELAGYLAELGSVQILSSDKLRPPVYRKFLNALAPDRKRPDFLIFDATFYKKEWRRQVKVLAQAEKVVTVFLECPLEVALQRNRKRQGNISEKAVHIMFHRMEPPNNPSVRIDTTTTTCVGAAAKITELIKNQLDEGSPKDKRGIFSRSVKDQPLG